MDEYIKREEIRRAYEKLTRSYGCHCLSLQSRAQITENRTITPTTARASRSPSVCKEVSMEPKNCTECKKRTTCKSWYGGCICTEAPHDHLRGEEEKRCERKISCFCCWPYWFCYASQSMQRTAGYPWTRP